MNQREELLEVMGNALLKSNGGSLLDCVVEILDAILATLPALGLNIVSVEEDIAAAPDVLGEKT